MAQPGEPRDSNKVVGGDAGPTNSSSTSTVSATLPSAPSTTNPHDNEDVDFDPSAEALVDEMDDERTLEEEEALAGNNADSVQTELDDLKKESEMPIEELLAYYQKMREQEAACSNQEGEDEENEEELEDEDEESDEEEEGENVKEVRKQSSERAVNRVTNEQSNHLDNDLQQKSNLIQQSHNHPAKCDQIATQSQNDEKQISNSQNNSNLLNNQYHPNSDISRSESHGQSDAHFSDSRSNSQNMGPDFQSEPTKTQESTHLPELPQEKDRSQTDCGAYLPSVSSTTRPRHTMTEILLGETSPEGIFKTFLDYDLDDSDDLDEDYSYTDEENDDERDWRRSIHIGPEHQADVPEGLSFYEGELLPYESEDKLVWRCNPELTEEEVLNYLKQASLIPKRNDISTSPSSVPKVSDDNVRSYRERFLDRMASHPSELDSTEMNDENIISEGPHENFHDVYMSQSRKRVKIDYELDQENAMDGLNQAPDEVQVGSGTVISSAEDNSTMTSGQGTRHELSIEEYFQDEEQLLYLLLQCNHNFEEALRRRRLDPFKYYINEPMSLWSQEECLGFEHGLRLYGKDFRLIRDNKVPTRTRAEVVAFYYLWKKSERHDVYTNQYKLDRKKCLSHPGTTDYMDKFIEDNESVLNTSTTPTEGTAEINISNTSHAYPSQSDAMPVRLTHQLPPSEIECLHVSESTRLTKAHYDTLTEDENRQRTICVDTDSSV